MANRVPCEVEEVTLTNEKGREVRGVRVTCSQCDHYTESYGTTSRSVKRCLTLLREECPMNQENFYVSEEDE